MTCRYFDRFLLQGVNRNWRQACLFYLTPGLICEGYWQVNSRRSFFRIADPTSGFPDPFSSGALILKAITPCAKTGFGHAKLVIIYVEENFSVLLVISIKTIFSVFIGMHVREVSRRRLSASQVVRPDQTRRHQWSPRTMYGCHSCSPLATVGPSI